MDRFVAANRQRSAYRGEEPPAVEVLGEGRHRQDTRSGQNIGQLASKRYCGYHGVVPSVSSLTHDNQ